MNVLIGQDPKDPTSIAYPPVDFTAELEQGIKGMKIALPQELFEDTIQPQVQEAVLQAARYCGDMGATVTPVSMPTLHHAIPAYYIISSAEVSVNLLGAERFPYGHLAVSQERPEEFQTAIHPEKFGNEVKQRIMLGAFLLSNANYAACYQKALQVRTLIRQEFARIFTRYDVILSPVSPTTAPRIGEKISRLANTYPGDICTIPVNIAGLPALSLPYGTDSEGLPIGIQLMAPPLGEKMLFRVASALEKTQK